MNGLILYLWTESENDSANQEMLSQGPVRGQLFQNANAKSLQITALSVAAFIVFWTPYHILFFFFAFYKSEVTEIDDRALLWILFFGMVQI